MFFHGLIVHFCWALKNISLSVCTTFYLIPYCRQSWLLSTFGIYDKITSMYIYPSSCFPEYITVCNKINCMHILLFFLSPSLKCKLHWKKICHWSYLFGYLSPVTITFLSMWYIWCLENLVASMINILIYITYWIKCEV